MTILPNDGAHFYTAQDVATFCGVELKTIHNWVNKGKIVASRTEGRHLRFRRNDLVRFFREYEFPMPREVARARPSVAVCCAEPRDEAIRKVSTRFLFRRYANAIEAIARVHASAFDAIIVSTQDPTLAGDRSMVALRRAAPWVVLVGVRAPGEARTSNAYDVLVDDASPGRIVTDLAAALAV